MKNLTFALISLTLFSCNEKLPKPTQEGKNTFGCQINGKVYIPDGKTGFMAAKPIYGGFLKIGQGVGISIITFNKSNEEVEIYLTESIAKTYLLNENTGFSPNQLFPKNYALYRKDGVTYITSQQNIGKIIIEKSEVSSGIISGTFEFTGGAGIPTVSITKGRFDINSKTLN